MHHVPNAGGRTALLFGSLGEHGAANVTTRRLGKKDKALELGLSPKEQELEPRLWQCIIMWTGCFTIIMSWLMRIFKSFGSKRGCL